MGTIRSLSKKKVFVVDDSLVYTEILRHELNVLKNIHVTTFSSAEECFTKLKENPNLIILDFYLDGENPNNMSGHDALNALQKIDNCPEVLFVSSERNEGLLEEYKNFRNVDFLLKTSTGTEQIVQKVKEKLNVE